MLGFTSGSVGVPDPVWPPYHDAVSRFGRSALSPQFVCGVSRRPADSEQRVESVVCREQVVECVRGDRLVVLLAPLGLDGDLL